jgi:SPP1 family predicted phage head-tail adaptor
MSEIGNLYNNVFGLYRISHTADGHGGWLETYTRVATFDGRLRPASSAERETAAQEQRAISHVLYAATDCGVARGDQVRGADRVLTVQAVREPSHAGHHLEIDCLELQAEGQP